MSAVPDSAYARLLQRAAEILGGEEPLRLRLGVSRLQLHQWLQGRARPPDNVFLRIADLLDEKQKRY